MIKYGKLNTSGVYKITCITTGEFYIGSSVNMNNRYRHHKCDLNHNNHGNVKLQRLWNTYGENCFIFEVIEYCDKDILRDREQYYIDLNKNNNLLCNISLDSKSIMGGRNHTKESKDKISKSLNGKPKRKRFDINSKFIEIYNIWKTGEITAVKAMELTGLKKTTFYKLVKEYENSERR